MRETAHRPRIDPEPFIVLVGVAGIVGGVASVFSVYKAYAKDSPVKARRTALDLSNQAVDELLGLAADLDTIEAILAKAEISGNREFRPETVAFLREKEFSRYEDATDSMYGRLRTLLRITNKLDRQLPRLPEVRVVAAAKEISEAQDRLKRVLRDPKISIDQALTDLSIAIQHVIKLIESLRSDLQA